MATVSYQTLNKPRARPFVERWFFTAMAMVMLTVSIAGFMPAIVNPAGRRAPLTFLAAAHGIVFFAWLLLFLTQSLLAATGHVRWHRKLGLASVVILAAMIPLGFETTAVMVRRGFDLSGDQKIDSHPPAGSVSLDGYFASVFNYGDLLMFAILAIAAICYRRRPEVHKRLMLFANIALMAAPVVHIFGHTPQLAPLLKPAIVAIPVAMFLLAGVVRDYLVARRVHPLTAGLAFAMYASYPIRGILIGPSPAWHRFAAWLSQ
jgi:FtsH-binding integral membrane protein